MKQVSKFVNEVLTSEYFSIKYRPGINNFALDLSCSSLLTYLALADIRGDEKQRHDLICKFHDVVNKCKNDEELSNLNNFLLQASDIGGYAKKFYTLVKPLLRTDGTKKDFKDIKIESKEKAIPMAVSSIGDNGLISKYFEIKYRPVSLDNNFVLSCSSFLTYLAIADATRSEGAYNNVDIYFNKALSLCKNIDDITAFGNFFKTISEKGGYAAYFYKNNKDNISLSVKTDKDSKKK